MPSSPVAGADLRARVQGLCLHHDAAAHPCVANRPCTYAINDHPSSIVKGNSPAMHSCVAAFAPYRHAEHLSAQSYVATHAATWQRGLQRRRPAAARPRLPLTRRWAASASAAPAPPVKCTAYQSELLLTRCTNRMELVSLSTDSSPAYQTRLVPPPLAGVARLLALRDAAQRRLLPAEARAVQCGVLRRRHPADACAQCILRAAAADILRLQHG